MSENNDSVTITRGKFSNHYDLRLIRKWERKFEKTSSARINLGRDN